MSESGSSNTMNVGEALKKYWWALALLGVAIILLFVFITKNNVTNAGNKKQQQLIYYYNQTENVLSDCLVKTKQDIGLAGAQTGALDKVITDAVKGRYTNGSTAQPGNGNALFSALAEAYPDTSGLSRTFENIQITINGCRSEFRDSQSTLQAAVTRFNEWKEGSFFVRTFGGGSYPNSKLAIKEGTKTITGEAALQKMRALVVVSEAQTARETGKIENSNPFEATK